MSIKPTKFRQGQRVRWCGSSGYPFKLELAVHFTEFSGAMPVNEQCEDFNVYAFYDEHGCMRYALERELESFIPCSGLEAWACQDRSLWARWESWKEIAGILGCSVESLISGTVTSASLERK